MRPWSIRQFEAVFLIWFIVAISLQAMAIRTVPDVRVLDLPVFYLYLAYALFALRIGLNLALWLYIAHRASRIARWAFVGLVGIDLAWRLWVAMPNGYRSEWAVPILPDFISIGVQLFSVWLLFRSDSARWFRDGPLESSNDLDETFS